MIMIIASIHPLLLKSSSHNLAELQKVSAKLKQVAYQKLNAQQLPLIFRLKSGKFALLAKVSTEHALVQFTDNSAPSQLTLAELEQEWSGEVIVLLGPALRFDVSWFIPEFIRHRKLFSQVIVFPLCSSCWHW
ncbi:hypothetical protein [Vibrio sp. 624788]|uniref:hypothetical protein n=1 Tax=Vibrio sp. 624788 TaxID=1234362 RepID=UPI001F4D2724|nr:hypothetical protein [Vibrio sp. 624788]